MRKTNWLQWAIISLPTLLFTYLLWDSQNWLLTYLAIFPWMTFVYSSVIALKYDGGKNGK